MTRKLSPGGLALLLLVLVVPGCSPPPVSSGGPAVSRPDPEVAEPRPEADATDARVETPDDGLEPAADLRYLELVVGGADPEARLPMIVAIHGLGDDPRNFVSLLADLPVPARVILPRAIDPHEPGWSWFPVRARDPDVPRLAEGIAHAADRIDAAVTELQTRRPTLGKPVVTGFSQGGMLAFALAVRHPEHYARAIPVGGWLPPPLWPEAVDADRPLPPLVALHGEADPAVKFEPTKAAVDHLVGLGARVELRAYPEVGHFIPPPMRHDLHELLVEAARGQTPPADRPAQ